MLPASANAALAVALTFTDFTSQHELSADEGASHDSACQHSVLWHTERHTGVCLAPKLACSEILDYVRWFVVGPPAACAFSPHHVFGDVRGTCERLHSQWSNAGRQNKYVAKEEPPLERRLLDDVLRGSSSSSSATSGGGGGDGGGGTLVLPYRDPWARLLSGFRDKAFEICRLNTTCFAVRCCRLAPVLPSGCHKTSVAVTDQPAHSRLLVHPICILIRPSCVAVGVCAQEGFVPWYSRDESLPPLARYLSAVTDFCDDDDAKSANRGEGEGQHCHPVEELNPHFWPQTRHCLSDLPALLHSGIRLVPASLDAPRGAVDGLDAISDAFTPDRQGKFYGAMGGGYRHPTGAYRHCVALWPYHFRQARRYLQVRGPHTHAPRAILGWTRNPQPTAHSPQPTAHSPQRTHLRRCLLVRATPERPSSCTRPPCNLASHHPTNSPPSQPDYDALRLLFNASFGSEAKLAAASTSSTPSVVCPLDTYDIRPQQQQQQQQAKEQPRSTSAGSSASNRTVTSPGDLGAR